MCPLSLRGAIGLSVFSVETLWPLPGDVLGDWALARPEQVVTECPWVTSANQGPSLPRDGGGGQHGFPLLLGPVL